MPGLASRSLRAEARAKAWGKRSRKEPNKLFNFSRSRSDRALGKPKKSGAGGKFNWGSSLDTDSALGTSDPRDPNYDSAEESSHTVCLQTAISVEAKIYKDRVGIMHYIV